MEYSQYLQTPHWQEIRTEKLSKVDHCQICDSKEKLHVHHKWYHVSEKIAFHQDRESGNILFKEKIGDLIVLCASCHKLWHIYFGKVYLRHKFHSRLRKLIRHGIERKKAFWLCTEPGLLQTITSKIYN